MAVPLHEFFRAFQLLGIVVLDTQGTADFLDHILIGSRILAAGCFFARRVSFLPVCVDIPACEGWSGFRMRAPLLGELGMTGPDGRAFGRIVQGRGY